MPANLLTEFDCQIGDGSIGIFAELGMSQLASERASGNGTTEGKGLTAVFAQCSADFRFH